MTINVFCNIENLDTTAILRVYYSEQNQYWPNTDSLKLQSLKQPTPSDGGLQPKGPHAYCEKMTAHRKRQDYVCG